MPSNPIQQRIDLLCEKWEESKSVSAARLIHFRCQPDESDMVDNFFTYMIGSDTPISDIAFHFDALCSDPKTFSSLLLSELEEIIDIWNNSQKDPAIEYVPIRWKANRAMANDKNPAAMFVQNFNTLAKELDLPEGLFTVAILKNISNAKSLAMWLSEALLAGIDQRVKILTYDRVDLPFLNEIKLSPLGKSVAIIPINLNMPKAMEQIAAMGDPNDPATAYRHTFVKMMNEMAAGNEAEAEKFGNECIQMASKNCAVDPFWIMQVVLVNTALGNDKIRFKKKEEALAYANKAVEASIVSKDFFENDISAVLMAQAFMFRGSVFCFINNRLEAYNDYTNAFELYHQQANITLAIEAARMAGDSAQRLGLKAKAASVLAKGIRLGSRLNPETAEATTFAILLDQLLLSNYTAEISISEIEKIAVPLYGSEWVKKIKNSKQTPDIIAIKKQEKTTAASS